MASAPRRELPCKSSDDDLRLTFRNELTACLTLVAPVGMTEEAKREWLMVAWDTLKHLDRTEIEIGARKAREKCDHPAKIVPAILKAIEEEMPWRSIIRNSIADDRPTERLPAPDYVTHEEAREILDEFGIKRDWTA